MITYVSAAQEKHRSPKSAQFGNYVRAQINDIFLCYCEYSAAA